MKLKRIIFDFAVNCLSKGSTFFGCLFANNLGFHDAVWWCLAEEGPAHNNMKAFDEDGGMSVFFG